MSKKEEVECDPFIEYKMKVKLQSVKKLKKLIFLRGTHTEINRLSPKAIDMLEEIKNDPIMMLIYADDVITCAEAGIEVYEKYDVENCLIFEFEEFSFFSMHETGYGKKPLVFNDVGIIIDLIPHI